MIWPNYQRNLRSSSLCLQIIRICKEMRYPALDTTGEPTNRHLAKLVEQLSMDVRDTCNDTLLLLDQKRLENSSTNARSRACFFCRLANAHQWGTTNCPEAQAMVKEGFCVF